MEVRAKPPIRSRAPGWRTAALSAQPTFMHLAAVIPMFRGPLYCEERGKIDLAHFSLEKCSAVQSRRGKAAMAKHGAGKEIAEKIKLWERLGISRATCRRRHIKRGIRSREMASEPNCYQEIVF